MAEEQKPVIRRKMYLVDKELQYRFIGAWFLMTIGFVIFILGILYFSLKIMNVAPLGEDIAKNLKMILVVNSVAIVVLTFLFFIISLWQSHRIAGPAYRVGVSLRKITQGDCRFRVTLRKADYFKPIATNLNHLLETLDHKNTKLKEVREKSQNLTERLNTLDGIPPELRELSFSIHSDLEKVLGTGEEEGTPTGSTQKPAGGPLEQQAI